jgi:CHAT domain-containing protein/tetratricopeptide (TPR) repeat protein
MAPSPHQQPCQDSDKLQDLIERLRRLPRNSVTIPKRIQLCCQALKQIQQAEQPELFARLHFETGLCLAQMSIGDPNDSDGQEQAISHFEQALEVFTPATYFFEWLDTTYNLALLYEQCIRSDRANAIERAIRLHEEIVELCSPQISLTDRAASHTALGRLYFQRIEGDKAENLETAIQHCQQALKVWTRDEHTISWAEVQDLLGTLFRRRLHGDPTKNLEDSLCHHHTALKALEPIHGTCAEDWARIHHNLGTTLLHRISDNRRDNLEQAITHFEEALKVRTRDTMPVEWAETQHNLAIAYIERQQEDRTQDVERAIELLNAVSQVHRREAFPIKWAINQSILGNAYLKRIRGERAENIERAIRSYEQALEEKNWGAHTEEKADAEHNLAVSYSERLLKGRIENLEKAVKYGEAALKTIDQYSLTKWALIKTDMVDILWKLANLERQRHVGQAAATMEKAIAHGEEVVSAMEGQPPSHRWALAHYNLGNVYGDRIQGDRADNQEKAIAHYNRALDFYDDKNYPVRWADTHNNLGVTYWERLGGGRTENMAHAIRHFRTALEVVTPQAFPVAARRAARNLGNLLFAEGRWTEAHTVYDVALQAAEILYQTSFMDAGREIEIGENTTLYVHDAFCLAHMGRIAEGIERLEAGKTRTLSERLGRDAVQLQKTSREDQAEYERLIKQLKQLEARQRISTLASDREVLSGQIYLEIANKVKLTRQELDAFIERIRQQVPDFLPTPLDFTAIPALLPDAQTAVVFLCVTERGSVIFVVRQDTESQVVWAERFTLADMHRLLLETSSQVQSWLERYQRSEENPETWQTALSEITASQGQYRVGWQVAYQLVYQLLQVTPKNHPARDSARLAWLAAIERVLAEVGFGLIMPLHAELQRYDLTRLILIPQGSLFLLPLHAVPIDQNGACLLDRYEVSFAPSASVLQRCQERAAGAQTQGLFAVANPTRGLVFTRSEVEAIGSLFGEHKTILEPNGGIKEKTLGQAEGHGYLHFSCHGTYDWSEPLHSALLLAGDLEQNEEGRLTLAEIEEKLDLSKTRLVTLSACETGLTEALGPRAEEYVGLPAGFLLAGAPAVVASLWAVDDLSTALLIERFYRYHLEGNPDCLPPAQALRRAQQWLRDEVTAKMAAETCLQRAQEALQAKDVQAFKSAQEAFFYYDRKMPDSRPFAHPVYWAPFTMSGQ